VVEGGVDGLAVSNDAADQLHEYRDATTPPAQSQPVDEFGFVDKLLCVSQRVAEYA
jgi:hypothetical protein